MNRLAKRKLEELLYLTFMIICTVVMVGSLAIILSIVFAKGLPEMSLSMIFDVPSGGYYLGKGGGLFNAIVGSLLLAGGATVLAGLLSIPVVIGLHIYLHRRRGKSYLAWVTRFSFDVLTGVPSIVYGAFGYMIMALMGLKASLLAGIITVTILVIPITCRALDEVVRLTPKDVLFASYSLGATRWETGWKVLLRQAVSGFLTALLISFGRAIGDSASVLLTTGYSDRVPESLLDPAATLPLAIFFQISTPFPAVQARAYAAALILTIIVLGVSLGSRMLGMKLTRHMVR